jgi:hypothetical protein
VQEDQLKIKKHEFVVLVVINIHTDKVYICIKRQNIKVIIFMSNSYLQIGEFTKDFTKLLFDIKKTRNKPKKLPNREFIEDWL